MLLSSIFCLVWSNALASRRDTAILYSRIGIIILFYCIFLSYNNLFITYLDSGIGLFSGLFYTSSITQTFHILIFVISLLILNMTGFFPRKLLSTDFNTLNKLFSKIHIVKTRVLNDIIYKRSEQYSIVEYTLMLLLIITGSVFLISSNDLVSIFLSIELQSYGLYLLCTMYRNSESSTSAGLTYFLLGSLASCFILLGIGLIYANLGVTYLDSFYIINNLAGILDEQDITVYIPFCLIIMSIGFLFKISAAPFHFWSPDVYDGIPTIVTTFVAIIAKISILALLLQLVHYTNSIYITTQYNWTISLLVSSLLSLIIGTVLGLTQNRIKRLFAFSTISHLGFMLLALTINTVESTQSFIFYLVQYSLSNLNAFILLVAIGSSLYAYNDNDTNHNSLVDKQNSPIQLISQLKGYFHINSILALSLTITLFSFAGIPPLMGFFAKQMVFSAALQEGYIFLTLVGVLTSVISGVYYLFVVKTMFFSEHSYTFKKKFQDLIMPALVVKNNKITNTIELNNFSISSSLSIVISILTLVILLFMFMPNEWLHMSNLLAVVLFVPGSL
jgi:NADH-ubiquinone oxidoreductase chain 2|uniref:NADH-ubiquinone oxidoreductase chain 2 n=1 Tax=Penicillium citrinum TaxID=5077 RepID=A0A6H1XFC6_PENCI|nr:NADH dehydrogenase subunit 2 [Penicillium citrinum]QJA14304.1 NADH dehydrogenase subunit 2 [Penicillium citrinum]QUL58706.1 NADH dehydrogenase subunit 2 [Penicillium sp.]